MFAIAAYSAGSCKQFLFLLARPGQGTFPLVTNYFKSEGHPWPSSKMCQKKKESRGRKNQIQKTQPRRGVQSANAHRRLSQIIFVKTPSRRPVSNVPSRCFIDDFLRFSPRFPLVDGSYVPFQAESALIWSGTLPIAVKMSVYRCPFPVDTYDPLRYVVFLIMSLFRSKKNDHC